MVLLTREECTAILRGLSRADCPLEQKPSSLLNHVTYDSYEDAENCSERNEEVYRPRDGKFASNVKCSAF